MPSLLVDEPLTANSHGTQHTPHRAARGALIAALFTPLVLLLHGYHPYTEDGGLYLAEVKWLLNRALYPAYTDFVTQHLHFSIFPWLMADFTRLSHQPLDWVVLEFYVLSTWLTLWSIWMLAGRVVRTLQGRIGAVLLLACWWSIPVAGTSLMLMDPYVTARSFSTPLILLALTMFLVFLNRHDAAGERKRAAILGCVALLAAILIHPLMAGFGAATLLLLFVFARTTGRRRAAILVTLTVAVLALCSALYAHTPPASASERLAAASRYYWFLSGWQWFELLGIVGPMIVLLLLNRRRATDPGEGLLIRALLALNIIAVVVCLCFPRDGMANFGVQSMQPMRSLHLLYLGMILLLGAWLGEVCLVQRTWRWCLAAVVLGSPMVYVARATTPASAHLEMPWRVPENPWVQTFLWIRTNTPEDAVFAMDPHYITLDTEDAQGFRALAERSSMPDYSKDGGEAGDTMSLADRWLAAVNAQASIDSESDEKRRALGLAYGATWLLLKVDSATSLACPYANSLVKVCRL